MMVKLYNVLSTAELQWIREFIAEAPFQDGKLSAGTLARDIKDNQELSLGGAENVEQLLRLYMTAYGRHRGFHNAALPQRVSDPIFARYDGGQTYGDHVDDAIMGGRGAPRFRCDVATTLFLSDPETYEGGELTVTTPFGRQTVKMKAGDAVVYPASSLHQV
ncbi:MAG: Fe2+-dependent dioxygenase, partial [Gammaproteobacteria bacterium]